MALPQDLPAGWDTHLMKLENGFANVSNNNWPPCRQLEHVIIGPSPGGIPGQVEKGGIMTGSARCLTVWLPAVSVDKVRVWEPRGASFIEYGDQTSPHHQPNYAGFRKTGNVVDPKTGKAGVSVEFKNWGTEAIFFLIGWQPH